MFTVMTSELELGDRFYLRRWKDVYEFGFHRNAFFHEVTRLPKRAPSGAWVVRTNMYMPDGGSELCFLIIPEMRVLLENDEGGIP